MPRIYSSAKTTFLRCARSLPRTRESDSALVGLRLAIMCTDRLPRLDGRCDRGAVCRSGLSPQRRRCRARRPRPEIEFRLTLRRCERGESRSAGLLSSAWICDRGPVEHGRRGPAVSDRSFTSAAAHLGASPRRAQNSRDRRGLQPATRDRQRRGRGDARRYRRAESGTACPRTYWTSELRSGPAASGRAPSDSGGAAFRFTQ